MQTSTATSESLLQQATRHVGDILTHALTHTSDKRALIVSDGQSPLGLVVAGAYRACLPEAQHLDFDAVSPETILEAFAQLEAGDLVVLVQSSSFRLGAFRIRVELFKRGLKVVEHPHLARMKPDEHATYIAALAYDPVYYRGLGAELKRRIDAASGGIIESGEGEQLFYESAFEPAKLNVGDYSALPNVGGQFPIGEVFTESLDLERVHGRVRIFVFGDTTFSVNVPERPITLVIAAGKVVGVENSTPEFDNVLAMIREHEELWVRELGFGMNRALTPTERVSDIGTYERMCGIHLSLGGKHGIYDKPNLRRRFTKYHVDVFAVTEGVLLDGQALFRDGAWTV